MQSLCPALHLGSCLIQSGASVNLQNCETDDGKFWLSRDSAAIPSQSHSVHAHSNKNAWRYCCWYFHQLLATELLIFITKATSLDRTTPAKYSAYAALVGLIFNFFAFQLWKIVLLGMPRTLHTKAGHFLQNSIQMELELLHVLVNFS